MQPAGCHVEHSCSNCRTAHDTVSGEFLHLFGRELSDRVLGGKEAGQLMYRDQRGPPFAVATRGRTTQCQQVVQGPHLPLPAGQRIVLQRLQSCLRQRAQYLVTGLV